MTEEQQQLLDDYARDEIIDVKLPRKDFEVFRAIIEREKAYNWFQLQIRTFWVWALVGGAISVITLWNLVGDLFKGIK